MRQRESAYNSDIDQHQLQVRIREVGYVYLETSSQSLLFATQKTFDASHGDTLVQMLSIVEEIVEFLSSFSLVVGLMRDTARPLDSIAHLEEIAQIRFLFVGDVVFD